MTCVVVGKTEFWTDLTQAEIQNRFRDPSPFSKHTRRFGDQLLVNISDDDAPARWVAPGEISAIWSTNPHHGAGH